MLPLLVATNTYSTRGAMDIAKKYIIQLPNRKGRGLVLIVF